MISSYEFKKRETELCDRIRELCEQMNMLGQEGKDITEISVQLEMTLEELRIFKRRFKSIFIP